MSFWKDAIYEPSDEFDSLTKKNLKASYRNANQSMENSLDADLILLHAPSIYDFRKKDEIFHANLSTSDCGVTPVYEMYPLGFKSIQRFLHTRGHSVKIINIASLMLRYAHLDVTSFLDKLTARVFGIDLHWMIHVQGALGLAEDLKMIHPSTPVIFGGISSTYYSDQLILYPQIDMVLRGYDTLEPLSQLMSLIKSGKQDFSMVPNLCYKDSNKFVKTCDFTYHPETIPRLDWSQFGDNSQKTPSANPKLTSSPYIFMLTSTGCAHNCPWCGGSRDAFRRIMGKQGRTVVYKPIEEMTKEIESLGEVSNTGMFIYALQWYCEPRDRIIPLVQAAKKAGVNKMQFELFHLTPLETVREMCKYIKPIFNLSPQSHDIEISKLAGRGTFTMKEMEKWIERVLQLGVHSINIWFFVGMPKQTRDSVFDTVDYCRSLLIKFKGSNVIPVICPMIPFLDPGSNFFVEPEKYGYKIFHRSLEEHRKAMLSLSLRGRLNYETNWMSREQIIYTSYEAVRRLVIAKGELGLLPKSIVENVVIRIDEAVELMREIDEAEDKGLDLTMIKEKMKAYNRKILSSRTDQIFPAERSLDERWFDEFEYNPEVV